MLAIVVKVGPRVFYLGTGGLVEKECRLHRFYIGE